jgi:FSR family fosmidomycin resistance protein-like MFS transporter
MPSVRRCEGQDDGGLELNSGNRRYLLVIALSHIILDMYSGMLPALIPHLRDKFLLSYSAAGALLAWSSMTSSLIQPVLGFVSDMTGGLGLVIGGLALSSLAIASTGYITSYPLLAAAAIMAGLGNAVYH